jgi:hypothetical protein
LLPSRLILAAATACAIHDRDALAIVNGAGQVRGSGPLVIRMGHNKKDVHLESSVGLRNSQGLLGVGR